MKMVSAMFGQVVVIFRLSKQSIKCIILFYLTYYVFGYDKRTKSRENLGCKMLPFKLTQNPLLNPVKIT